MSNPESTRFHNVVEILINSPDQNQSFIKFLSRSTNLKINMDSLFNASTNSPDLHKRQSLYEIVLDIIEISEDSQMFENMEYRLQIIRQLSQFPDQFTRIELYLKLARVIRKIYALSGIGTDEDVKILNIIKNSQMVNAIFILSVFSERFQNLRKEVLDKISESMPNISSLAMLSSSFAIKYLTHETYQNEKFSASNIKLSLINIFNGPDFTTFDYQCTLCYITSLMKYLTPPDACSLFLHEVVLKIQSMINESETSKSLVFNLVESLPVASASQPFDVTAQLTAFLPYISINNSFDSKNASNDAVFEGEIAEKIANFALARKDDSMFKVTLNALPNKKSTYYSAILIGVKTGLLKDDEELLRLCFPQEPRKETSLLMIKSISFCTKNGVINEQNAKIVCLAIMASLRDHEFALNEECLKEVGMALNCLSNFCDHIFSSFVYFIPKIASVYALSLICKYLNDKYGINSADSNANARQIPTNSDLSFDFCASVSVLVRFLAYKTITLETKTIFLQFLKTFAVGIGHEITELPKAASLMSPNKLVSIFVPGRLMQEFLAKSFQLFYEMKDNSYTIDCVAAPGLDNQKMMEITNAVNNSLNPIVYSLFYATRINVASTDTLKTLFQKTKQAQSGWFKKAPPIEFNLCIISTITLILQCVNLKESDMTILMDLIEIAIPKNEEILFKVRNEAKEMIGELAKRTDAKPKEVFIDSLIGTPMYADYMPFLIRKVSPNERRLEDALSAWAMHTFEDPLARSMNESFVHALFEFSKSKNTLNIIINKLEALISNNVDPINALELAACAAEAANKCGIQYTANSVSLILICSEYMLSPGLELRKATTKLLINLFQLKNVSTEENYEKNLAPADISAIFMNSFIMIFAALNVNVCLTIFDRAVSASPLKLHHVMLIRSLLSVHSNSFVENQVAPLIKLCTFKANKLDASILAQVQKSILYFAGDNTAAFTRFLSVLSVNELTMTCINRLMMRESLRNAFLDEYAKVISVSPIHALNFKIGVYQILNIITSSDINMDSTGRILVCVLTWLGLLFMSRLKSESKPSYSSELKHLSQLFANLLNNRPIHLNISDFESYTNCLQLIADQIISIDSAQLSSFLDTSLMLINAACSESSVAVIGIVLIHLLKRFSYYQSSLSKSYLEKISSILTLCFSSNNSINNNNNNIKNKIPIRILSSTLNSTINTDILKQIPSGEQSRILHSIMESIIISSNNINDEFLINPTCEICCWLLINVSETSSIDGKILASLVSKFFNNLPISISLISVLESLVKRGIDFIGKFGATKLNYVNLVSIMATSPRSDIQEKLSTVLMRMTNTGNEGEMISKVIRTLERNETIQLCKVLGNNCGAQNISLITERLLNTLIQISNETYPYREEVAPFHAIVFRLCINVISHSQNEACIEIAKNALEHM
ncbi:hypothetical protein TRFO_12701 [Tritrichomonas foetus]|uniref:Uncharacterized protein n=1 Tax=Tritrichomonas foetus TaxID=1144522 RepID=A0A1J4L504_9EUKA|nr:hypothetical protein TRFO_12701 [Tritrichomonas foetus]|eukprot:OHT17013.1 hypothetical protein TRFO_12701 [Tritrichomonas foetus]